MRVTKEEIQASVLQILNDMLARFNKGEITINSETKLVADLEFSSIDMMHLLASVNMHFKRKLPYDELVMKDGQYVDEIRIDTLVNFVDANFDREARGPLMLG